jgi:hypothetical protein
MKFFLVCCIHEADLRVGEGPLFARRETDHHPVGTLVDHHAANHLPARQQQRVERARGPFLRRRLCRRGASLNSRPEDNETSQGQDQQAHRAVHCQRENLAPRRQAGLRVVTRPRGLYAARLMAGIALARLRVSKTVMPASFHVPALARCTLLWARCADDNVRRTLDRKPG